MDSTFEAFNKNQDGFLTIEEFKHLCNALFRNEKGRAYKLQDSWLNRIFSLFDKNTDGYIDKSEFELCWEKWIKTIICPVSAIIIVDVQNDFISGSLSISNCPAGQDALEVIEPINNLLDTVRFEAVFYTLDWHPNNHISFIDNVSMRKIHPSSPKNAENAQVYDTVIFRNDADDDHGSDQGSDDQDNDVSNTIIQKLWPRHCVQDSWGSELHNDLKILDSAIKIYKGTHPELDSYSAFFDNNKETSTKLNSELKSRRVTDVYICGLAYDVCVKATALDALDLGYRTVLVDDCCRGIDLTKIEETKEVITSKNGVIVDSNQVEAMVEGRVRRPELGYKLAMNLKEALKV